MFFIFIATIIILSLSGMLCLGTDKVALGMLYFCLDAVAIAFVYSKYSLREVVEGDSAYAFFKMAKKPRKKSAGSSSGWTDCGLEMLDCGSVVPDCDCSLPDCDCDCGS